MIENSNFNPKWNNDKCQSEHKNPIKDVYAKKIMFGILVHASGSVINIARLMNIRVCANQIK